MSLKGKLSTEFNPRIRDRGFAYFRSNAVRILEHDESSVLAAVKGSRNYLVKLTLGRVALNVACTCLYFDRGEECKHVWATMLAADSLNYLAEANRLPRLEVRDDYEALAELRGLATEKYSFVSATEPAAVPATVPQEPEPPWKRKLQALSSSVKSNLVTGARDWPAGREIFYSVDPAATRAKGILTVEVGYRELNAKGEWGKIKPKRITLETIPSIPDEIDRQILTTLSGARDASWNFYSYNYPGNASSSRFQLTDSLVQLLFPRMCETSRCIFTPSPRDLEPRRISWDEGSPYELALVVHPDNAAAEYTLRGFLRRGVEEIPADSPVVTASGIVIFSDGRAARLNSKGVKTWTDALRGADLRIPASDSDELVAQLLDLPAPPRLELPESLHFERVKLQPQPHLVIRKPAYIYASQTKLEADLIFEYAGLQLNASDSRAGVYDRVARRFIERDREAEAKFVDFLKTAGVRSTRNFDNTERHELPSRNLPRTVAKLLGAGWKVEAEGKLYRKPGASSISVSSGIDWFELHGSVDFGDGLTAKLPAILKALKRGDSMIALGDGSFGLMPEEWLEKYGLLASLGVAEEDHLRFKQTQTGVLDALLAARPEITCDAAFARVREEWRSFGGIDSITEPEGFVGELREYQREGLGWFAFLQRFGFGGCLADDMGLGKTVQVLALLESRRNGSENGGNRKAKRAAHLPSLVVVPRSLIFNWQQEASRFTPGLRLLTHTGSERTKGSAHFENYDLILTTYGTLRRDALHFEEAEFDFVILDEAQAIKNSKTESAKAARLLRAKHRLALSGTPIENHLGELWSLFEFLNPGMLGAASVFQMSTNGTRPVEEETRVLLSRALRPFLLRRTKDQVARELPEKLEQTIYCEMEGAQRKQYDELREFYRTSLLQKIETLGIQRSKIQILEALLRLRQTACHPGLVTGEVDDAAPNAKLDILMPRLGEVIEEGHKILVFSQFTSFLSIVKRRLDQEGIEYAYLDGRTRARGDVVDRFQSDPNCKLFLISLKAGGQGLNLTAAEYVFLLDPWWNPALEAQAIDRAHRIGQSQRVFAYRLITRDTVEEKVLALQSSKKDLADAIISADNSVIKNITGEDLMLLLS